MKRFQQDDDGLTDEDDDIAVALSSADREAIRQNVLVAHNRFECLRNAAAAASVARNDTQ